MLEKEKIQAGMRTEANEDHLLLTRGSYKVHPNLKNNTSHILLALPFFCVRLQPDFKIQKKQIHKEVALQFRQVLDCLTFIPMKTLPCGDSGHKMFFLVQNLTS